MLAKVSGPCRLRWCSGRAYSREGLEAESVPSHFNLHPDSHMVFKLDDILVLVAPTAMADVLVFPSRMTFWKGAEEYQTVGAEVTGTGDRRLAWSLLPAGPEGGSLRYTRTEVGRIEFAALDAGVAYRF